MEVKLPTRIGAPSSVIIPRRLDTAFRNPQQDACTLALMIIREKYGEGKFRSLFNVFGDRVAGNKGWTQERKQVRARDEKGHPISNPVNVRRVDLVVNHKGRERIIRVTVESPNRELDGFKVTYEWIK